MSTQSQSQQSKPRVTVPRIAARKGGEPIVCLTAYSAPMAKLLDPHVDVLLVGDSVGMVVHGFESTLDVTLEHMIMHGQAVVRGAETALVVVDMPFGSYEESPELAYRNAVRVLRETGCSAVKLEGGVDMAETIRFLTRRGVPVMGHVGLQPQSVRQTGGYKVVGRDRDDWGQVEEDARAVADAGAFSIVLEGMAAPLAAKVTKLVPSPTIGIGASAECDGQVLVIDDMLGMFAWAPKFVKQYANLRDPISAAAKAYAAEVRARAFPAEEHTYKVKDKSPPLVVAS